ncbi:ABC transporter substrate-binding protein [Paenibacillus sp. GCM10012303]|jgi:multiple sugar transport system substrate-binding protein|uniref:ABC transporter substrate-binding protein n=1 Tax=Paenibacillus sp. GCM10012303 TaxID=3317340 RepID=UPI00360F05B9
MRIGWKETGILLSVSVLASACGKTAGETEKTVLPPEERKPAVIRLLQDGATMTEEEFQTLVQAPVKAKYPHLTVELQVNTKSDEGLQQLIAGGDFPELILTSFSRIAIHREMATSSDLTPLVKQSGMDLNRFDSVPLETVRKYSKPGELSAIPFSLNFLATFYNKDLFDNFGVPYPPDGMTWDDALEIAKRFSRTTGGVQYRGAMMTGLFDLNSQLSLPYFSPETRKVSINTDGWKRMVNLIAQFQLIPGNRGTNLDHFMKEQSVAMMFSYDARFHNLEAVYGTPTDFKWDVAQLPSFPERPNVSAGSTGHYLMVSSLGANKQDAFRVIEVLVGAENQKTMTQRGRFTSLKDPAIKALYGQNLKSVQGKNIQGIFKSSFAPPFAGTMHDTKVRPYVQTALNKVIEGQADVNSALREAEETANRELVLTP